MIFDYKVLGQRLKLIRAKQHFTQECLAERAGLSPTYIRYIESGRRTVPLDTLITIVNVLGCSVDDLLIGYLHSSRRQPQYPEILSALDGLTQKEIDWIYHLVCEFKELMHQHP